MGRTGLVLLAVLATALLAASRPVPMAAGRLSLHLAVADLVGEGIAMDGMLPVWTGRWSLGLPLRLITGPAQLLLAVLRLLVPGVSLHRAVLALTMPLLTGATASLIVVLMRMGIPSRSATLGALAAVVLVPASPLSLPGLLSQGELGQLVAGALAVTAASFLTGPRKPLMLAAMVVAVAVLADPWCLTVVLLFACAAKARGRHVLSAVTAGLGLAAFWLLSKHAYLALTLHSHAPPVPLATSFFSGALLDHSTGPGLPGPHTLTMVLALCLALVGRGRGLRTLLKLAVALGVVGFLLAGAPDGPYQLDPAVYFGRLLGLIWQTAPDLPVQGGAVLGRVVLVLVLCEGVALSTLLDSGLPGKTMAAVVIAWLIAGAAGTALRPPVPDASEITTLKDRLRFVQSSRGPFGLSAGMSLREHTAALIVLQGGTVSVPLPRVSELAPLSRWHEGLQGAADRDPALFLLLLERHGMGGFLADGEALGLEPPGGITVVTAAEEVVFSREVWWATAETGTTTWGPNVVFQMNATVPKSDRTIARYSLPANARGWIVVPLGFDPAMSVSIDGKSVGTALASPGFLAARATGGSLLEVRYGTPPMEGAGRSLTMLSLMGLVIASIVEKRVRSSP